MSNLARINQHTGIVDNIIAPYGPPNGYIEVPIPENQNVQIGWTYSNGEFSAPPPPPPTQENQL